MTRGSGGAGRAGDPLWPAEGGDVSQHASVQQASGCNAQGRLAYRKQMA